VKSAVKFLKIFLAIKKTVSIFFVLDHVILSQRKLVDLKNVLYVVKSFGYVRIKKKEGVA